MKNKPLVSVIIPTKNSAKFLDKCLMSIKKQSYKNIEIIVVDSHSSDKTNEIAKRYKARFFSLDSERSKARNFGVNKSNGDFVLIIDSDMEPEKDVIKSCYEALINDKDVKGITIPEESFGEGFWAKCKKLEKSFYNGVDWMEAARFFSKNTYLKLGGYNESLISGEDFDLSQRCEKFGKIYRIDKVIFHNEGKINLLKTVKKKYYYAQHFAKYLSVTENKDKVSKQTGILARYKLFLSDPIKLFRNPIVGLGMIFMKTCEFGFGGLGYLIVKAKTQHMKK